MTILEAEEIYCIEVEKYENEHKKKYKGIAIALFIVVCILLIVSIILLYLGYSQPATIIDSSGYEWTNLDAEFEKIYGFMVLGFVIIALCVACYVIIYSKKGPKNYLHLNKELYLNYIRCEDVSNEDKEFYKQKLEDIRTAEITNAVNRAADAAVVATMTHFIKK